jgi:hypothetical protein
MAMTATLREAATAVVMVDKRKKDMGVAAAMVRTPTTFPPSRAKNATQAVHPPGKAS